MVKSSCYTNPVMRVLSILALSLASLCCAAAEGRKQHTPVLRLEITEVTARRVENQIVVDGRVRNDSRRPLQAVVLVFDFLSPDSRVVTTRRGALEDEVLEDGQEASFHFRMPDAVRAVWFRVRAQVRGGREPEVRNPGPFPVE
jgi:hypothetical protein